MGRPSRAGRWRSVRRASASSVHSRPVRPEALAGAAALVAVGAASAAAVGAAVAFGGGGGGGFGGGGGAPSGGPPRAPRPPRDFDDAGPGRRPAAKGKAKPERAAPKGPIRERNSGRMLDIDDSDDAGTSEIEDDFDDFATSKESEKDDDE